MYIENIKKDLLNFPSYFDKENFKQVLIKTIKDSEDIIVLGNQLDIKNNNGDKIDIDKLITSIESNNDISFLKNKQIYAVETLGNPYILIKTAISAVYTQNAIIFNGETKNHGTNKIIIILIQTLLKEGYGLNHIIEYVNKSGYEELIKNKEVIILK